MHADVKAEGKCEGRKKALVRAFAHPALSPPFAVRRLDLAGRNSPSLLISLAMGEEHDFFLPI